MSYPLVYFFKRKPSTDGLEELRDSVAGILNQHWWAEDTASCPYTIYPRYFAR